MKMSTNQNDQTELITSRDPSIQIIDHRIIKQMEMMKFLYFMSVFQTTKSYKL